MLRRLDLLFGIFCCLALLTTRPATATGWVNIRDDCPGVKGDGVTDDFAAINSCLQAHPGATFFFPKTQPTPTPSYKISQTLRPVGDGTLLLGENSGFSNRNASLAGTVLQFTAGRTGIWFDSGQASTQGDTAVIPTCTNCGLENLSLLGAEGTNQQSDPTKFILPSDANLPIFDREITKIQRQNRVLSVTVTLMGNEEGLTQQVGATIKISGVTGDPSMNGLCTISQGLTPPSNPDNFQCVQLGDDSGPFTTPTGMVSLPTTGPSDADGVRVCQNFITINRVIVQNFGRHGINLDSSRGCMSRSSNHFIISSSGVIDNQGDGIFCRGVPNCSAGTVRDSFFYYNGLWAGEDQTNLGNTWEANEASYNGPGAADGTRLVCGTTKGQVDCPSASIQTIARGARGSAKVTISPSSALAKVVEIGDAIVISGTSDPSFNTPTGFHLTVQGSSIATGAAFFVTEVSQDKAEFEFIQPGAPADASATGGTARIADFSEAYLAAGVDGGSYKIGTASQSQSFVAINNYTEGGQFCKYGTSGLVLSGVATLNCPPTDSWHGNFVMNGAVAFSTDILGSNMGVFQNLRDSGYSMHFQAGIYGNEHADQPLYWRIWNHNGDTTGLTTGNEAWRWKYSPTGPTTNTSYGEDGALANIQLFRGAETVARLSLSGPSAGGGTHINSEDIPAANGGVVTPTPVRINADHASGTGGLEIDDGGTAPVKVASIDGHGIVTASGFRTGQTTNSDTAGQITLTSGTASRIFTGTYTTAPVCVASDITATDPVRVTISAKPFTMTLAGTGKDTVNYICVGLQ